MKTSQSIYIIYKSHLIDGHKEAMKMVSTILANVLDDIDIDGVEVTPKEIEERLAEKAMIHLGPEASDEVA